MKNLNAISAMLATVVTLLTMSGCASLSEKMDKGISATDCFAAGGTIDSSSGASMCVMGEGESKPIT